MCVCVCVCVCVRSNGCCFASFLFVHRSCPRTLPYVIHQLLDCRRRLRDKQWSVPSYGELRDSPSHVFPHGVWQPHYRGTDNLSSSHPCTYRCGTSWSAHNGCTNHECASHNGAVPLGGTNVSHTRCGVSFFHFLSQYSSIMREFTMGVFHTVQGVWSYHIWIATNVLFSNFARTPFKSVLYSRPGLL